MNSFGMLTIGGAVSLVLGSTILIDTDIPSLKISFGVILPTVAAFVLFVIFAVGMGLKAQSLKPTSGSEGLVGEIGEALEDLDPTGKVFVHGEYWQGHSKNKIAAGQAVKVVSLKGMKLIVESTTEEV